MYIDSSTNILLDKKIKRIINLSKTNNTRKDENFSR